jgi:hypothetical protein
MKLILGIVILALFSSGMASADVIPLETSSCTAKNLGDACVLNGVAGNCESHTCSRLDYSNWNRDASLSPPMATYTCLWCQVTENPTGGADTPPDASPNTNEKKDSGCSVGGAASFRQIAPWMMAGSVSLLFLFFRRRRSR